MALIKTRVDEMWWLFGFVLPVEGVDNKEMIKNTLGHGLEQIIPEVMPVLAQYCEKDLEKFEMYLDFISQAIKYMKGETDSHPEVDVDRSEYEKFMQIQLGTYKNPKKIKQVDSHETFNPPEET